MDSTDGGFMVHLVIFGLHGFGRFSPRCRGMHWGRGCGWQVAARLGGDRRSSDLSVMGSVLSGRNGQCCALALRGVWAGVSGGWCFAARTRLAVGSGMINLRSKVIRFTGWGDAHGRGYL